MIAQPLLRALVSPVTIRAMSDGKKVSAMLTGVELYFVDLQRARGFYAGVLGRQVSEEDEMRFAKFDFGAGFVCLERKGSESYPSQDKAVLFFEVPDLEAAINAIGADRFVQREAAWAALHDPEGITFC